MDEFMETRVDPPLRRQTSALGKGWAHTNHTRNWRLDAELQGDLSWPEDMKRE